MINSRKLNYLIIFFFIGMWISIGSDPYDYLVIFENQNYRKINLFKFDLKIIINFVRSIIPCTILLFSLYIVIKYKIFKDQKKFIYILFLIQIIQLITTFISKDSLMSDYETSIDFIGRFHWVISSISIIFIFMIASKIQNFKFTTLFYISIFFLTLMVIYFTVKILIDFYTNEITGSVYHLDVMRKSAYFLDHQMPRTTGLSRSIVLLYIFLLFLNYYLKDYLKFLNYLILIILGSLIFFFQSKFAFTTYLLTNIIFIFNSSDKIEKLKLFLFLLITQIILFYGISSSRIIFDKKMLNFNNSINFNTAKKEERKVRHFRSFNDTAHETRMDLIKNIISSGRFDLWQKALVYVKQRPFIGYGSMSDRHIINEKRLKNQKLVNPVSNAFIYSILSGGVFCLLLFLYFLLSIKEKILNILKINIKSDYHKSVASMIIFILCLRCLVENSIMLFGLDFILILNALYLTEKK